MDGGSNCHILIKEEYFVYFIRKHVPCSLANGEKSGFQGIGVALAELEPNTFVLLAPAYLSTKDDVNTISPSALKRYSKCKRAIHAAAEYFEVEMKGKTVRMKVETAAGLDYAKLKIHHLRRPMQTKLQRHPHIPVQPKFILHAQHHPDDPAHSELDLDSKN